MKKLKLTLMGTALASLLGSAAIAGDSSFSGFYLGGQLGYGTMKTEHAGRDNTSGGAGVIGGLHTGYGKHFPNRFYMGLEAYGNLSDTTTHKGNIQFTRNYSFGAKLRPGVVFGNALVYGVLGIESANFKPKSGKSERFTGFVPGLGVAFHATDHVIIGLEATHTMYGKRKGATPQATDFLARASYKW
jgi:outer membrane immunogenic protein